VIACWKYYGLGGEWIDVTHEFIDENGKKKW